MEKAQNSTADEAEAKRAQARRDVVVLRAIENADLAKVRVVDSRGQKIAIFGVLADPEGVYYESDGRIAVVANVSADRSEQDNQLPATVYLKQEGVKGPVTIERIVVDRAFAA